MSTTRARAAACSARPTAVRRGPRLCTWTIRPACRSSPGPPTTPRSCSRPPCGTTWHPRPAPPVFPLPAAGVAGGVVAVVRRRGGGPTQTKLFKSTDKGLTWHEISGGGLPELTGRTAVAVAMNTNTQRMFLIGNFGLYRSDDGGTTWRQMDAADRRIANGQGGYNCGVYVDPRNPDIVYTINTSSYK